MARRARIALWHLLSSALLLGVVIAWVLAVWYPPPFGRLEGVLSVLLLLAFVDVVLGPTTTLIIASPKKGYVELRRDIALIVAVQLAAAGYGVYSLAVARPAFIAFNADRFDVVSANELSPDALAAATDPQFARRPLLRPVLVHAEPPPSVEERQRILLSAATGGPDLKHLPKYYRTWPGNQSAIRSRLRPVSDLTTHNEVAAGAIDRLVRSHQLDARTLKYVPIVGHLRVGSALIREDTLAIVALTDLRPPY